MTIEASSLSLGQLLPLSLEERAKLIMAHGAMDLARSVRMLEQNGLTVPKDLQERIAWAVAWNIGTANPGSPDGGASRGIWTHDELQWSLDTVWKEVWCHLIKSPKGRNLGAGRILLDELALSVLCEQREEWQPEASRPLELGLADSAQTFIYNRDIGVVIGYLRKNFGDRAGEPEELAHEAWAATYERFWSREARQRFLGLAQISSFVCVVAGNKSKDILRNQRRQGSLLSLEESGSGGGEESDPSLSRLIGIEMDPGEHFLMEELRRKLDECMQALTPHQQIVAELIWLQEQPAKDVAEQFRVSKSAISQHLKRARESVKGCLERHGYRMSDK